MAFIAAFEKVALSPHTKEERMRATPKRFGGKSGRSVYKLRFHPEENRWSCSCKDWQYRRQVEGDCKHIKARLQDKKSWEIKTASGNYFLHNRPFLVTIGST